mmetsp:Transcript_131786/g.239613  ORF Transcript_131786/g.239613 Transcript_131786/m.239613 type:complete len:225 (+) Transcript_131786:333-1007(+)
MSPIRYVSTLRASTMRDRSLASIESKRLTFCKNLSYWSALFVAASLTTWLKVSRSRRQHKHLPHASTEAARGTLYNRASSPNTSPGAHFFSSFGPLGSIFLHSADPSSMIYKQSPSSPSVMILSWSWKSTCSNASRIQSKSASSSAVKRNEPDILLASESFCSGVLKYTGGLKSFFGTKASALTPDLAAILAATAGGGSISWSSSSSSSSDSSSISYLERALPC